MGVGQVSFTQPKLIHDTDTNTQGHKDPAHTLITINFMQTNLLLVHAFVTTRVDDNNAMLAG